MIKAVIFDFWGVVFNPITGEANEGLETFLQDVRARDWKCGIASSSSRRFITEFLEPRHLLDDFPVIVSIDDVTNTKPDPDCYFKVATELGAKPEECLIIDDSLPPIEIAQQHGFHTVLFGGEVQTFTDIHLDQ